MSQNMINLQLFGYKHGKLTVTTGDPGYNEESLEENIKVVNEDICNCHPGIVVTTKLQPPANKLWSAKTDYYRNLSASHPSPFP